MEARTNVSTVEFSLHISVLNKKLEELNYSVSAKDRMNSVWVLTAYAKQTKMHLLHTMKHFGKGKNVQLSCMDR